MVATTDCVEKTKSISGNKVSKPLMEKKRRARINKCLDQLKSLLESYYSSSIRKRKLEKADILELTVKHLKNLQKTRSFSTAAAEFSDYQSGFHSCLANFNQYLLMADHLSGRDRWMFAQLSSKLCCPLGRGDTSSTLDSGRGQAEAQDEAPRPEEEKSTNLKPHSAKPSQLLPSEDTQKSPGNKQSVHIDKSTKSTLEKRPSKTFQSTSPCRNEVANAQHNVWRPW